MRLWMRGAAVALLAALLLLAACGRTVSPATRAQALAGPVVVIGDSLSVGWYASDTNHSYAGLVRDDLHATLQLIATAGITAPATLAQIDSQEASSGQPAIPANAVAVVIELGTNDVSLTRAGTETQAQFTAAYSGIVSKARTEAPAAHLACLTTWHADGLSLVFDRWIAQLCTDMGGCTVRLSDLYDEPNDHGPDGRITAFGTGDTFHPNDQGHAAIAARTDGVLTGGCL